MMNITKALSTAATSEDMFCLKWSNFQRSVSSEFKKIQEEAELVDITFACEGGMFGAHKLVLFACSPYLKTVLKNNPCSHPIFFMNGVKQSILKSILDFMYLGEVRINQEDFTDFIRVAELFKIRGVTRDQNQADEAAAKNLNDLLSHEPQQHHEHHQQQEQQQQPISIVERPSKHKKARLHSNTSNVEHSIKKTSEFLFFNDAMQSGSTSAGKVIEEIQPKRETNDFPDEMCHQQTEYTTTSNRSSFAVEYEVPVSTPNSNACDETWLPEKEGHPSETQQQQQKFTKKSSGKAQCLVPSSCPVCGRVYSNISNLRQHLRLIHNPTTVDCPICHKSFNSDLYLKRHYLSMHNMTTTTDGSIKASSPTPSTAGGNNTIAVGTGGVVAVAGSGITFIANDVYSGGQGNKRIQQQQHHHQQQHHETTASPVPNSDQDIKIPMQQQQQQTWNPYESGMSHAL